MTFAQLAIEKGPHSIFIPSPAIIRHSCLGVKIMENCHVKEILTEKQRAGQYDRVTNAVTSQGNIKCDVFINCTGMVS